MTGHLDTKAKAAIIGKSMIVIYLDATKEFDRSSHHRPIKMSNPMRSSVLYSHVSRHIIHPEIMWCEQIVFTSSPRPVTSGITQSSVLLLFHANNVFKFVGNGAPFLFVDNPKIVYTFQPDAIGLTVADVIQEAIFAYTSDSEWAMKFTAGESRILC